MWLHAAFENDAQSRPVRAQAPELRLPRPPPRPPSQRRPGMYAWVTLTVTSTASLFVTANLNTINMHCWVMCMSMSHTSLRDTLCCSYWQPKQTNRNYPVGKLLQHWYCSKEQPCST